MRVRVRVRVRKSPANHILVHIGSRTRESLPPLNVGTGVGPYLQGLTQTQESVLAPPGCIFDSLQGSGSEGFAIRHNRNPTRNRARITITSRITITIGTYAPNRRCALDALRQNKRLPKHVPRETWLRHN